MISHVFIGIEDYARAYPFYATLMKALGFQQKFADEGKEWAGWFAPGLPRPLFVIGRPFDGAPHDAGNGQMTALLAPSRTAVEAAYSAAIGAGGTCEGAPGLRPHYHPNYFGAYFRDPEGNKLGVCCHD